MRRSYLPILLSIIINNLSFSQKITIDEDSILIGEHVNLNISIKCNKEEEIKWPTHTDYLIDKVEIIHIDDITKSIEDSLIIISQNLKITSFDTGTYNIPSITINNKKTNELTLHVSTIIMNDDSTMRGNTPPKIGTEDDFTEEELMQMRKAWWKKAFYISLIILLSLIIYYIIKKIRNKKLGIAPKIQVPIHTKALNKLQELENEKISEGGKIKEYYSRISIIIREYTEQRFNFNALELPTSDIIKELYKKSINNKDILILELILQKADQIKYAKGRSKEIEDKETMKISRQFINRTKISEDGNSK